MKPVRTIKFVARQTGLSIHAIRVWEKRYGAVRPVRSENNRRLYSEEDVERLRLLRAATLAGAAIGQIALASIPELHQLLRETGVQLPTTVEAHKDEREGADSFRKKAITAISGFNSEGFAKLLDRAAMNLGSPGVLQKFIAPLAEEVGELWRAGEFTIAHEHFATDHITGFLAAFARPYSENPFAPHMVLATPCGQLHEIGAIIAAAAARTHGWRTTYLGPSLPVEELAGVLRELKPRALGLSIVFPPDDLALVRDLKKLRQLSPRNFPIIVGGRSIESYEEILREIRAIQVSRLEKLFPVLDRLQLGADRPVKVRAK